MNNVTPKELALMLEELASEREEEQILKRQVISSLYGAFDAGYSKGVIDTYRLCAQWIREDLCNEQKRRI